MLGKNFKIHKQFLDYWKINLLNSPIWSFIPHAEQPPKICPPSAMKSIYKKVTHLVFLGGRHYALAPLENHVGVYAPSLFELKCGLKLSQKDCMTE